MCVNSGAGTGYPSGAPEFHWGYTVYILFIGGSDKHKYDNYTSDLDLQYNNYVIYVKFVLYVDLI